VDELAAADVKRISLATSLYFAAMTGLLDAASQVKETGQFDFLDRCVTTPELTQLMRTQPAGLATYLTTTTCVMCSYSCIF
jgi:2-methylisocitrate lyase-like PEP mutase family enzyme